MAVEGEGAGDSTSGGNTWAGRAEIIDVDELDAWELSVTLACGRASGLATLKNGFLEDTKDRGWRPSYCEDTASTSG